MPGNEAASFFDSWRLSQDAQQMLAAAGEMLAEATDTTDAGKYLNLQRAAMALQVQALEMLKQSDRLALDEAERQRELAVRQLADLRQI